MADCSETYSSRRVLLEEEFISATCSLTSSITSAYQVAIQLFVVTTKEIYMRTQAVSAKRLNVKK